MTSATADTTQLPYRTCSTSTSAVLTAALRDHTRNHERRPGEPQARETGGRRGKRNPDTDRPSANRDRTETATETTAANTDRHWRRERACTSLRSPKLRTDKNSPRKQLVGQLQVMSQPTLWGHASRVPGRGLAGAVPLRSPGRPRSGGVRGRGARPPSLLPVRPESRATRRTYGGRQLLGSVEGTRTRRGR